MKATYNLEGDDILAVKCYVEIMKVRAAISANTIYPNLQAVSQESSSGISALQQQLIGYGGLLLSKNVEVTPARRCRCC